MAGYIPRLMSDSHTRRRFVPYRNWRRFASSSIKHLIIGFLGGGVGGKIRSRFALERYLRLFAFWSGFRVFGSDLR